MIRFFSYLSSSVVGALLVISMIGFGNTYFPLTGIGDISFDQFIAITLTSITVFLAFISLGLSLLSFVGINAIRETAERAAKVEAEEIVDKALKSDGVLAKKVDDYLKRNAEEIIAASQSVSDARMEELDG